MKTSIKPNQKGEYIWEVMITTLTRKHFSVERSNDCVALFPRLHAYEADPPTDSTLLPQDTGGNYLPEYAKHALQVILS